jgi:hypothetical protein
MILLLVLLLAQVTPAAPQVKISGRVIDGSTGKPAAGAEVTVIGKTVVPAQTRSNANGEFELMVEPKIRYALRAVRAPLASMPVVLTPTRDEADIGILMGIGGANGMPNTTALAMADDLVVYSGSVGTTGAVLVDGGGAIPKGEKPITFTLEAGNAAPTKLTPNLQPTGTFRLDIVEGDYKFAVGDLPKGYEVKSITYGAVDLRKDLLKVTKFPLGSITVTLGKP